MSWMRCANPSNSQRLTSLSVATRLCALLSIGALGSLGDPVVVFAQRNPIEAEQMLSSSIRQANANYDNLEIDGMNDELENIFEIARRFGTPTPRMRADVAQAYILKGVGLYVDREDKQGARRFFIRALQTDPNTRLDVRFSSPDLVEIFREAQSEAAPSGYGRPSNGGYGAPGYQGQGGGYAQGQPQGYPPQGQQGGYPPQGQQGGYPPQGQQGGYPQGQQRGYPPQGQQGSYPPQGQQGGYPPQGQQVGYPPQGQQGGYPPQGQQGGYTAQGQQNPYGQAPSTPTGYATPGQATGYGAQAQPNAGYGAQARPAQSNTPELSHSPPRQIQAGAPFNVRLRVSSFLRPQVAWARLFYQTIGTNGAQRIDMRPVSDVDFEGQVPANFITGNRIQYYMVIYNQSDDPIASYKNHREPEAVTISAGSYGGLVGGGGLVKTANPAGDSFMTLSIMPGTGAGRITSRSRLQTQKDKAIETEGFAFSPFHVNLEVDFSLGQTFEIGIFSRLQIIETAALGGLQLHINAVNNGEQKFAFRAGAGYGKVRHLVSLSIPNEMGQPEKYLDTTLEGPVFYKAGLSYAFKLSETWSFKSALDFTHLIALNACAPIAGQGTGQTATAGVDSSTNCDSPSIHFDFNLGVAADF